MQLCARKDTKNRTKSVPKKVRLGNRKAVKNDNPAENRKYGHPRVSIHFRSTLFCRSRRAWV